MITIVSDDDVNNNDVLLMPFSNKQAATNEFSFDNSGILRSRGRTMSSPQASDDENSVNVLDMFEGMENHDEDGLLGESLMTEDDATLLAEFRSQVKAPIMTPRVEFAQDGHPGNNRFYIMISLHRREFMDEHEKGHVLLCNEIAKRIIRTVCIDCYPRGRFLETATRGSRDGLWVNSGQGQDVIELVKAALKCPPKAQLSKFSFHDHALDPNSDVEEEVAIGFNPLFKPVKKDQGPRLIGAHFEPQVVASEQSIQSTYTGGESESAFSYSSVQVLNVYVNKVQSRGRRSRRQKRGKNRKNHSELRRRGVISSTHDLSFPDKHFGINENLQCLAQGGLNESSHINSGESDNSSEFQHSSSAYDAVKRRKASRTQSVCSSTSSLGGLRGEFAEDCNIGLSAWKSPLKKNMSSRRKTTKISEDPKTFKVTCADKNSSTRLLEKCDVLCQSKPMIGILPLNHIGNNRLRIMLQMNYRRYNDIHLSLSGKNRIIFEITQRLSRGEFKGCLVFQDKDRWIETGTEHIPTIVKQLLEECCSDPSHFKLPSWDEKPLMKLSIDGNKCSKNFNEYSDAALKNMKKRRRKKLITSRDERDIAMLQNAVLKKVVSKAK